MRHLDLFSGIGGFSLAARWVWGDEHEIVAFCENNPFRRAVLRKHWPHVPMVENIHDLKGTDYADVALLTGGFPCQPFSVAGVHRGANDDRYLWPEMFRVICEAKPRFVLVENVDRLPYADNGLVLESMYVALESEGYSVTPPFIVPACSVCAPHPRQRTWFVADANGNGRTEFLCDDIGGRLEQISEVWKQVPTALESDWELMSQLEKGLGEPAIFGNDDGLSHRLDKRRLAAIGDAIVPQVAVPFLQAIRGLMRK